MTGHPVSLLFVCMGNICRSPAAEGIFRDFLRQRGLEDEIIVDSAGTLGYHSGELADKRMREAAHRRGYDLTSRARQVRVQDLDRFDLIVVMDYENLEGVRALDPEGIHGDKIRTLCSFIDGCDVCEVPDPYYGGLDGFDYVLDLLEQACEPILDSLQRELQRA